MNVSHRLTELRSFMEKNDIAVSIVMNPDNQFYLSGFKAILYSRPIVLSIMENKVDLVVPGLEEAHAKSEANADEIHVYYEHPEMSEQAANHTTLVKKILSGYSKDTRIGFDLAHAPAELVFEVEKLGYKAVDVGRKITEMRYIKDQDEIDLMIEAGQLVNLAVSKSLESCKPGVTELEIDAVGNTALFSKTASKHPNATLGFFVMSPSGEKRSIMPHVFSNTRKLNVGDVMIHSRQVAFNGYRAELERTVIIGKPTEQQIKAFKTAQNAQQAALEFIKPGVTAAQVDKVARDVIEKEGFGKYAIHRVGHGIGVSEHEEPYLRFDNDLVLEDGMAFSIEPGFYIPGLGGFRHSDTVILTPDGNKIITEYPRDLESLVFD
ncbi:M24 family metallopeptidase [Scopulibacillus cellulosilyticus]|uniref:M24 family metallopeptidase n=1 Tax=Scopulibacillus cellulosilyticus TaxID=2665665 RepID=A0ABW2Q3C1_9BACL